MTQLLLKEYLKQKRIKLEGNIYHKTQVNLAYNSNRIEGSRLSEDQTRQIFETRTVSGDVRVDDINETENHFRAFDYLLETAQQDLSVELVKELHRVLKSNTTQAASDPIYTPGIFKTAPNEVGAIRTSTPLAVAKDMDDLLASYADSSHDFADVIDFHYRFESIHPFQDGNGRVGRLVMFRECLVNDIVPFIVSDNEKIFYLRGLANYREEKGWLLDTCASFQDRFIKDFLYLTPDIAAEIEQNQGISTFRS
ncbi:MAG: Fic family protein [Raoultibacter sp.]